jgi:hypothetical protein
MALTFDKVANKTWGKDDIVRPCRPGGRARPALYARRRRRRRRSHLSELMDASPSSLPD